jgi:hypothetical protein
MNKYERPVAKVLDSTTEGVYMASGDDDNNVARVCRFGRTEASAGADTCQSCSKTGGVSATEQAYRADYTGCIENMPEKDS